jgi:hypothetical protein
MAEAGDLAAGAAHGPTLGLRARACLDQEAPAKLRGPEHDGTAAEDTGRDRALERPGIGGQRHPRNLVGGHEAVLGYGDQQEVQEESLVRGRLLTGQKEVEVIGEAHPAHKVTAEVPAPDRNGTGIGRADRRGRAAGVPNQHHYLPLYSQRNIAGRCQSRSA